MDKNRFLDRLRAGTLTRREFHRGLAAAGLGLVTLPLVPGRAQAADLTVFTWDGYGEEMFHQPYLAAHGASPEFGIFGEEEEAFQKLRAGYRADISHPCTSSVRRWRDAGLLKPLDVSRIPEWDNIYPSFKNIKGVYVDGDPFLVPWDWGNDSILYRTDLVEIEEPSFSLLLDERYKGRIAFGDSVDSFAYYAGLIAGVADPANMTDAEIEQAADVMRRIHRNVRFYWVDVTQLDQALASGEIVATNSWNETVWSLKDQGIPVAYMDPKEGILTWVCGLALMQDGPGSEDLAYDFINAMLDPETGANVINEYGYGHANMRSADLVDPAQLEIIGISNPKKLMESSNFYDEMPNETREKLIALFDEIKAGF